MKDFFFFVKDNFRKVSFGWVLTFLSGFGQTFLISLYVPEIIKTFQISEGAFGSLYAACTIVASFIMLSVGHTVDYKPAKKVTAWTIIGLGLSSILLGFSYHILFLFIAITGLRLTGQGLLTHISMTIMSKRFTKDRGKALSFSTLGFSMSEAVFPIIISLIIGFFNWRVAAIASGIIVFLYLIRLKYIDLMVFDEQLSGQGRQSALVLLKDYKKIVFDKKFVVMMPASFILSFTATAIFFYQYVFVENKGWSVTLYATFFTVYAITRFLFSLLGGVWVDKFTARKMFRYYLIPVTLGMLPLALMDSIIGALIFLIFTGVTVGVSGTVKTALLAEIYGTEKMGAIRSVFTMFMVISTALGPLVVGLLMDAGVSFENLILGLFAATGLVIINSQRIKYYQGIPEEVPA
ncbi:MFS transporter [Salinimicrobium xinjiangense]|uniref:MFS transporter n=1 Tax=Salinimicrobium xinjiangense TaxID=438596 RepID=UPI00048FDD6D|nr:MFS transporter [Salinimicrobium xinjiangense]